MKIVIEFIKREPKSYIDKRTKETKSFTKISIKSGNNLYNAADFDGWAAGWAEGTLLDVKVVDKQWTDANGNVKVSHNLVKKNEIDGELDEIRARLDKLEGQKPVGEVDKAMAFSKEFMDDTAVDNGPIPF